jgi:hypothetical protein
VTKIALSAGSGEVVADDGCTHAVRDVFDLAEEVHRKW